MNPKLLNTQKVLHYWPAKVLAAIGVMACLSVPFAISIGNSASFVLFEFSMVLVFSFLLIAAMRGVRDLYLFIWVYVGTAGFLIWLAWFVFGLRSSKGINRLSSLYTWDANDAGLILLTALPLALLTFQTSKTKGKVISAVIVVAIGMTIARTGSRGAFLGAIAMGAALLFMLGSVSPVKRILFVVVAGGALAVSAPEGYWDQMRTMISPKEDYNWSSSYGRKELWKRGMGYMMSNPLFGIGVHNFQRAEGQISYVVEMHEQTGRGRIKWSAAHNSFLQVAAEMGIPGVILWSTLVFGGIIGLRRLRRKLPKQWARGDPEQRFIYNATIFIPISLIGFAVTAAFLTFAYVEVIYILTAFVVGTYVAADNKLRQRPTGAVPARRPGKVAAWRRRVPSQAPVPR